MNPISNEFSVAKGNLLFDKAKAKLDEITRFKDVLKTEQKKVNNLSLSNKTVGNNKLMNACYEFESIFVNQMFKVMRSTVNRKDSLMYGGPAEDIFNDMLYDQYSLKVAKTGEFGLSKQIYDQLNQLMRKQ